MAATTPQGFTVIDPIAIAFLFGLGLGAWVEWLIERELHYLDYLSRQSDDRDD